MLASEVVVLLKLGQPAFSLLYIFAGMLIGGAINALLTGKIVVRRYPLKNPEEEYKIVTYSRAKEPSSFFMAIISNTIIASLLIILVTCSLRIEEHASVCPLCAFDWWLSFQLSPSHLCRV